MTGSSFNGKKSEAYGAAMAAAAATNRWRTVRHKGGHPAEGEDGGELDVREGIVRHEHDLG